MCYKWHNQSIDVNCIEYKHSRYSEDDCQYSNLWQLKKTLSSDSIEKYKKVQNSKNNDCNQVQINMVMETWNTKMTLTDQL